MDTTLVSSPIGVMTVLVAVVSFWFWLERSTKWKIFDYLPPLVFIYASPVLLSNFGVIPYTSAAYDFLRQYGLPMFIVLMLIKVDVISAVRIMGKGVFVMLLGSVGVVFGGVMAYKLGQVLTFGDFFPLAQDSWRAFGTLAGSWIGGTLSFLRFTWTLILGALVPRGSVWATISRPASLPGGETQLTK